MIDSAAAMLAHLLEITNTSQRRLAEDLGWSAQLLNSRLKKDSFPANDWIEAIRHLGYQVVPYAAKAPVEPMRKDGVCPDFRKVVDGQVYDKSSATALGHQWFDGGLRELYRADDGRYFLVNQICWPKLNTSVCPVTKEAADEFLAEKSTMKR